jgi:NADPH:quinone reductase-like Zn-dependent oxidoreductase
LKESVMKAATCRRYGPPEAMSVEQVKWPWPKANEVLVKVHSSSVTSGDVRLRAFTGAGIFWIPIRLLFGILRPRNPVPGMEFSGRIEAIGKEVTRFKVGDPVFGMCLRGANAEYLTVPEASNLVIKPVSMSYEEAAATPFGALSALEFLRDIARLKSGERVMVYGASGAVGVFAVQLAKHFGAEVTGVCSTANVSLVRSLGADAVIDYTTTNFLKDEARYDLILDAVGGTSFTRARHVLAPKGRYVFLVQETAALLQAAWTSLLPGKRAITGYSGGESSDDLHYIAQLIEAGRLRPVIDRRFDLTEIVHAHRYVETGRKQGAVIISVEATGAPSLCPLEAPIHTISNASELLIVDSTPEKVL